MSSNTLYFRWCDGDTDAYFNDSESEHVIHFDIKHREGNPARLFMSLVLTKKENFFELIGRQGVLLFVDQQKKEDILFKGYVLDAYYGADGITKLCLESCVTEKKKEEEEYLLNQIKQHDYWNPLVDDNSLDGAMGLFSMCPYWDRSTAKMRTSRAFSSEKEDWDLSHCLDPRTLTVYEKTPVSLIDVTVSAQWLQQWSQYQDIFPIMAEKFSDKKMATYTQPALVASWPKAGPVRNSGYHIVYSHIWELTPSALDRPFYGHRGHLIKKFYFDGQVIVARRYKQKRKEVLRFQMMSSFYKKGHSGKNLTLNLGCLVSENLLDIPDFSPMCFYKKNDKVKHCGKIYVFRPEEMFVFSFEDQDWDLSVDASEKMEMSLRDTFFVSKETKDLTQRGLCVFKNALQRAKSLLAWESRCVEIHVRVPFVACRNITVDHMGVVWDPKQSRRLRGKVVSIHMKYGQDESWIDLVIKGMPDGPAKEIKEMPKDAKCMDGVYYAVEKGCDPENPVEDMVKEYLCPSNCVSIQNDPQDQEKAISSGENAELMRCKGTSIHVSFPSLKSNPCLENAISVTLLSDYDVHNEYVKNK